MNSRSKRLSTRLMACATFEASAATTSVHEDFEDCVQLAANFTLNGIQFAPGTGWLRKPGDHTLLPVASGDEGDSSSVRSTSRSSRDTEIQNPAIPFTAGSVITSSIAFRTRSQWFDTSGGTTLGALGLVDSTDPCIGLPGSNSYLAAYLTLKITSELGSVIAKANTAGTPVIENDHWYKFTATFEHTGTAVTVCRLLADIGPNGLSKPAIISPTQVVINSANTGLLSAGNVFIDWNGGTSGN